MKTLFRVLMVATLLTVFGALSAFAQEDFLATKFEQFKKERVKPCGERDAALTTGKAIIDWSNDPANKETADLNKAVIDYVKKQVAIIEKEDPICKTNNAYNAAFKAKDWAKFFPLSKEIIAREGNSPLGLDVTLELVSAGYDRTVVDKNDTYNSDTINYAKQALQKLNSGISSEKYGIFVPFKTKENAISWMNYILGFYTDRTAGNDPAKKKEALSYIYKATQVGEKKTDVAIYTSIGGYYFAEAAKLDEKFREIRATNPSSETEEGKAKLAEADALLALARGYADRGIDAFARARKIARENKAPQAQIDEIGKSLTDLYKFRFNIAPTAPTPDLENYVSGMLSKPMPDPATDVTPVTEEVKPATTTTTTSTTPTSTTTPTPTKATTNTTPTKQPTSTTTKTTPVTTTATTTKTSTTVKKPVTKKKGTR